MNRQRQTEALLVVFTMFLSASSPVAASPRNHDNTNPKLKVFALRYADDTYFASSSVYREPESKNPVHFSWLFYLLITPEKKVLIDSGIRTEPSSSEYLRRWQLKHVTDPRVLLSRLKINPEDITELVITHAHADHAGNIDVFPNAKIVISRTAYRSALKDRFVGPKIRRIDQSRFAIFENSYELASNIKVYTCGGHAPGTSCLELSGGAPESAILFTSDNCYLNTNCRDQKYTGSTVDPKENKAFIDRIHDYPGMILTHHDPSAIQTNSLQEKNIALVYAN